MKDRIKQFIEQKGISAGELAGMLDVQRSNISHILNGRNKPGASFIEKLLVVFPDLNARWLLTGAGAMLEGDVEATQPMSNKLLFENIVPPPPKESVETEYKKIEIKEIPVNEREDDLDRMVLLYKDGTFVTYKKR
ncbi:helix-turn-helix transcriptional regulator [Prolixibacteraceae bacterium Z1-6]|uniref:Helix-turn-helix transcriptional regulator n=1 Tax=Draconibacterium aestuarii TaxID=2998507 RepID=A0A9X3F9C3_9BACT|nr:helix-turn-helix transcriptional regulator [Prolixibacteraceae bacterium Z1-6]